MGFLITAQLTYRKGFKIKSQKPKTARDFNFENRNIPMLQKSSKIEEREVLKSYQSNYEYFLLLYAKQYNFCAWVGGTGKMAK